MAWQVHSRERRGIKYQDDANPQKYAIDVTLAPLHYESTPDSGEHDTAIDCTPVRVQTAALDGWRIIANGFHYALGQPGDKPTDGWVGFGGRQGQNWLRFRLLRLGYLRGTNRAWADIGGAPSYNRLNLSNETHPFIVPTTGEQLPVASIATWSGLWSTPSGGDVSVSWRVNGDQLKEEVTLSQAGREWIAANRPPTTPLAQTWFGFVFQLDWSDVPRVVKNAILQDREGDFADDGLPVELRDSLDRLLGFLPVDDCIVRDAEGAELARTPLRKRFWKDGDGNYYLLVGVRCDVLNGLPAGDLVFDPTIDVSVGASGDDGKTAPSDSFSATSQIWVGNYYGPWSSWLRFTGISGLSGTTITSSYVTNSESAKYGTPAALIYAEYAGTPTAPTSTSDYWSRTRTTNSVAWTGNASPTPSLNSIIQELADNFDPGTIQIFLQDNSSAGNENFYDYLPYDWGGVSALHIEYTAGGTAYTLTADQGNYTLSGQAANLLFGRSLLAAQGSYSLTGQAAGLLAARKLIAAQGSYALTGQDTGLLVTRKLAAAQGAYALTGQTAGLLFGRLLTAGQGDYTLTGQTAALLIARLLSAGQGSYSLTGQDANLLFGRSLSAGQGSYTLSGQDANLLFGRSLSAAYGAYTLTGQDAGLLTTRLLSADYGLYALTGQAVTLVYSGGGLIHYTLTAGQGSYALLGQDAGLLAARLMTGAYGAYVLTGQDTALLIGRLLAAAQGSYALSGQDSVLLIARLLTAAQSGYTLSGQDAILRHGYSMTASQGAYTLTGQDAAFSLARVLAVLTGLYSLNGQNVTLVYSGEVIILPTTPDSRIYVVGIEDRAYIVALEDRTLDVPVESRVFNA